MILKRLSLYCLFVLSVILSSCGGAEIDVFINAGADYVDGGMDVSGDTNLPDGAMVFVNIAPLIEQEVKVINGKIETFIDFSEFDGAFLPEGEYTFEVIFIPSQNTSSKFKNIKLIENENVFEEDGENIYYMGSGFDIGYDVSDDQLKALIGNTVPFDKWAEWGQPETKEGTNNVFWSAYLPDVSVSFISLKIDDTIVYAGRGEEGLEKFFIERQDKLENAFSGWDGSHINLTIMIKESLNDPKSYEHVETVFWDKGSYLTVKATFRGKNAFGGLVLNAVTANADLDGNIIEIVSQEP